MARPTTAPIRRILVAFIALALLPLLAGGGTQLAEDAQAATEVTISDVRATPIADGSKVVFTWTTDVPTTSIVHYGDDPDDLKHSSAKLLPIKTLGDTPTPVYETQHLVIVGAGAFTLYYQVGGNPEGGTTTFSATDSVEPENGPTHWDGDEYVFNHYVKFDTDVSRTLLERWAVAVATMGLLVEDMTDGYARLGTVILEDSTHYDPNGYTLCGGLLSCLTSADTVIPATAPFDSHTFAGGIESGNPIVLGRNGQLIIPWQDTDHRAWVWAHEFGHYAFWLPDQYAESGNAECINKTWDVSIMHNSNQYTEMDHSGTPCDWQEANGGKNSWDDFFRPHYPNVPHRDTPDEGPCDFGTCSGTPASGFETFIIDR